MKKIFTPFFLYLLLLCCSNMAKTQPLCEGIVWVLPIDSSAYPVNNNITGNDELNQIFKEFQVEEYYFWGNIFLDINYIGYTPVYEIRLKISDCTQEMEEKLCLLLQESYSTLFKFILRPYVDYFDGTHHSKYGMYFFHLIDFSARPCSPISSCNEQLNSILNRYEILHYERPFASSPNPFLYCVAMLSFRFTDAADLYYDLLSLSHLLDNILTCPSSCASPILDKTLPSADSYINYLQEKGFEPCYIGILDPEQESIIVSPNPVHDYVSISGITPQIITLYDWQGKVVLAQTEHTNRINISHLQRGLYLLHVISNTGNVFVQKIVKE